VTFGDAITSTRRRTKFAAKSGSRP
jgi:hypothetical protein